MKLYLAYGANTNREQMAVRCPDARYVCNVTLQDHRLVFRGVADVVQKSGAKVECAMWAITENCEKALDRFEGFPYMYVKRYITTHLNGKRHRVMLYVMHSQPTRGQHIPPESYERTLRDGYKTHGLPLRQINDAIRRAASWEEKHPPVTRYAGKWAKEDAQRREPRPFGAPRVIEVGDDEAVDAALASIRESLGGEAA